MRLSSCISLDLLYIHNGDEPSENITTHFTDYFHKTVTLARFGIGSLMIVQVDRNM